MRNQDCDRCTLEVDLQVGLSFRADSCASEEGMLEALSLDAARDLVAPAGPLCFQRLVVVAVLVREVLISSLI